MYSRNTNHPWWNIYTDRHFIVEEGKIIANKLAGKLQTISPTPTDSYLQCSLYTRIWITFRKQPQLLIVITIGIFRGYRFRVLITPFSLLVLLSSLHFFSGFSSSASSSCVFSAWHWVFFLSNNSSHSLTLLLLSICIYIYIKQNNIFRYNIK